MKHSILRTNQIAGFVIMTPTYLLCEYLQAGWKQGIKSADSCKFYVKYANPESLLV